MEINTMACVTSAPTSVNARQSTSGAVFVVLQPVNDPENLAMLADYVEKRAESAGSEADAHRLRRVAARLRARSG